MIEKPFLSRITNRLCDLGHSHSFKVFQQPSNNRERTDFLNLYIDDMTLLKGKVVDIFNSETYNETINIGDMYFKVFKFFRVTKESGMLILFARVGEKFYGGMRYDESTNEESLCAGLANMIIDGLFEPTNQIELHARLGRKVEMLDKTFAITFIPSDIKKRLYMRLDKEFDKECRKMPLGLSYRDKKRFYNHILKKITKEIGKQVGIPNADHKVVKDMFWKCDCTFPNFDDDAYIQMLKGEKGEAWKIGEYHYVDNKKDNDKRNFVNEIIYNDKWGANYDRERSEMLGGYSEDGVTFRPDFRVTELDDDNVPNALALCSMLFEAKGKIDMPYAELEAELNKCHSEAN